MQIEELYTQVVLSHSASSKNRRHLDGATITEHGVNPSCGDDITLELAIDEQKNITDVSFTGSGCAISQASVSILADLIRGKHISEAQQLLLHFQTMLDGGPVDPALLEASVFAAMAHLPARMKCAALGWRTLERALSSYGEEKNG